MANDWYLRNPEEYKATKRRHYLKRKAQLDEIKLSRGCVDCGYNRAPEALHFDHRDPTTKRFNVSQSGRSWVDTLVEIAKCDVRCANCHAIKTKALGQHRKD